MVMTEIKNESSDMLINRYKLNVFLLHSKDVVIQDMGVAYLCHQMGLYVYISI